MTELIDSPSYSLHQKCLEKIKCNMFGKKTCSTSIQAISHSAKWVEWSASSAHRHQIIQRSALPHSWIHTALVDRDSQLTWRLLTWLKKQLHSMLWKFCWYVITFFLKVTGGMLARLWKLHRTVYGRRPSNPAVTLWCSLVYLTSNGTPVGH